MLQGADPILKNSNNFLIILKNIQFKTLQQTIILRNYEDNNQNMESCRKIISTIVKLHNEVIEKCIVSLRQWRIEIKARFDRKEKSLSQKIKPYYLRRKSEN